MSTDKNGFAGHRMTGTTSGSNGENLNWLTDVASCHGLAQRPSDSVNSPAVTGQTNYSITRPSTMLASAASPGGLSGVFRPPLTIADATARLLSSGGSQFSTLYSPSGSRSNSSSQLSPYSGIQGGHEGSGGQGSHLSPHYSAFYTSQYGGYPRGALLANPHYPHIESYSAVLQSMGSQVQQTSHTQIPRTYGHPQYPLLGGAHQRSLSASVSPSPEVASHHPSAIPGNSIQGQGETILSDLKSRIDIRERKLHEQDYSSHIKEERTHSLSAIELTGGKSVSFKDPPRRDLVSTKDANYKVPSGKEGSMKHRILTRPSDSAIQSSLVDSRYSAYAAHHDTEEPVAKRSKYSTSSAVSFKSSHSAEVTSGKASSPRPTLSSQSQLHYPQHFMKGSIIQLTNGELKRVEDLQTDDFVQSAEISSDLKIDSSTVVKIEESPERGTVILGFVVGAHKVQVTVEATVEHPFFVFGQGWSSCEPERTLQHYGLECQKLSVGDVCISLTHKDVTAHAAEISQQQQRLQNQISPHQVPSPSNSSSQRSPKDSQGQGHSVPSPNNRSGNSPFTSQDLLDVNRPPRKRNWSSSSVHENDSTNPGQGGTNPGQGETADDRKPVSN